MMDRRLIKDLIDAFKASDQKKTTGYDTSATVRRIEDGIAWVHIPGGVDETPVKLTINASVGDSVQVRVSGGRAFLVGNGSAPPTDDTTAIKATHVAKSAQETAYQARDEASEAWHYAGTAKEAAESAQESADSAYESAMSANNSANSALTQLSIVEDVAGTLRWIQENADYVPSTDTTVQPNIIYFEYINGDYVPIVNPDPAKNPHEEGWYILDVTDSQASFIMAHLAVTNAGLWILPVDQMVSHQLVDSNDNDLIDSNNNLLVDYGKDEENIHQASGYKVLISGETTDNHPVGVSIYNSSGDLIANYGETTTIGNALLRNVYIDNQAVYIKNGETVLAKYGEQVELGENRDVAIGTSSNGSITEGYMLLDNNYSATLSHSVQSITAVSIKGRDSSTNEYYDDYSITSSDYTVVGKVITISNPISGTSIVPTSVQVTYTSSDKITQLKIGTNTGTINGTNYPIVVGNNNENIDPSNVFSVSWAGNIRTIGNLYLNGHSFPLGNITNYSGITGTHIYAGIDNFLDWAYMTLFEGIYIIDAEFSYVGLSGSSNTGCVSLKICVIPQSSSSSTPSSSTVVASARNLANVNSNYYAKIARTCVIKISELSTVCLVPSSHYEGTVSDVRFKAIKIL